MPKKAVIVVVIMAFVVIALALAIPPYIREHTVLSAAPCVNRLIQIESAKEQWALERNKSTNDTPKWDDLYPYLANSFTNHYWTNGEPVCPEGGIYSLGRVGVSPTCSIGGTRHSYP